MSPIFDAFSHYLAYGATDQETFRELRDDYNGILVPATIAAFQRQGTGGFVLSLSATSQAPPYVIDPRFPLFQQALEAPKKSHTALASLLGDPGLVVTKADPLPVEFDDFRIATIAKAWVTFNQGYGVRESEKFDKYAKRLGLDVRPDAAQGPEAILAPYFVSRGPSDPWWDRSQRFFEETVAATSDVPCLRVVCGPDARSVGELLTDLSEAERLVVWASDLNEHTVAVSDLINYRRAIAHGTDAGHEIFGLYGGFFSVLLRAVGLHGASHGVGFSEHRNWRELPSSGAPPARYYLPRAHRYVPQDLAQALYSIDPSLTQCDCEHCAGLPPVALDYHELMKHSVVCRTKEIAHWADIDNDDAAAILSDEYDALSLQISEVALPPRIRARAAASIEHIPNWVAALKAEL
jgi:hypothetical protein